MCVYAFCVHGCAYACVLDVDVTLDFKGAVQECAVQFVFSQVHSMFGHECIQHACKTLCSCASAWCGMHVTRHSDGPFLHMAVPKV